MRIYFEWQQRIFGDISTCHNIIVSDRLPKTFDEAKALLPEPDLHSLASFGEWYVKEIPEQFKHISDSEILSILSKCEDNNPEDVKRILFELAVKNNKNNLDFNMKKSSKAQNKKFIEVLSDLTLENQLLNEEIKELKYKLEKATAPEITALMLKMLDAFRQRAILAITNFDGDSTILLKYCQDTINLVDEFYDSITIKTHTKETE